MIEKNAKKGFTLIELIIVVAIMAVLVSLLAPNMLKYLEQTKVGKDISTLDVVRDMVNAEIADEYLSLLNTDERETNDAQIEGKFLSEIYQAMLTDPNDNKWGTLGNRLFGTEYEVLPETLRDTNAFVSRTGSGGRIKIYLNGSGGVAAVGVDGSGKILEDKERQFIVSTKFSDAELAMLDCMSD